MEECPRCKEKKGEYQGEDIEDDTSLFGITVEYREHYTCLNCGHEWDEITVRNVPGDDIYMW